MKKSLIALAALSAFATAAQAQSSVTVYGIIDAGYNNIETTTSAGVKTEGSQIVGGQFNGNGEAASSRLGFRGTEDLGGGLKANFLIETGIGFTGGTNTEGAAANSSNGTTTIGDRAFWAGLEDAKLGELRVGRQDTFTRTNWLAYDQLAAANVVGNLAHSNAGVANGTSTTDGSASAATGSHNTRNYAVNYISPRMSGVQVMLGVTQQDVEASNANKTKSGSGSQAALNYVQGKFAAGVAYVEATTSTNVVTATGIFATSAVTGISGSTGTNSAYTTLGVAGAAASNVKTKDTSVGASYDLGVAKLGYVYNKRDANNSIDAATLSNVDRTSHAFSASIPLSAKLVGRVGYGFGEYRNGATTVYNGDIKGMQAALNYNLSKRTMAYAIYGDESREISAATKAKAKEYSVGVRHSF
jgi:predicted porin